MLTIMKTEKMILLFLLRMMTAGLTTMHDYPTANRGKQIILFRPQCNVFLALYLDKMYLPFNAKTQQRDRY